MTNPANDVRSVSDLWQAALQADDDTAWNAVAALHWRGSREVLDQAIVLTRSNNPALREWGAHVLGQLGIPERTFPEESFSALLLLLGDEVLTVVSSAIYALGHVDCARAAAHIIPFASHGDDDIRHAVAFGLGSVDTPAAQKVLLKLMTDRDPDVRNWATFGIGQQSDADTDEIRAALTSAVSDNDADVRYEGVIGLGRRRDNQAIPYLKSLLYDEPEDIFAREATAKLLGFTESGQIPTVDLLGGLQRLQRWSSRTMSR